METNFNVRIAEALRKKMERKDNFRAGGYLRLNIFVMVRSFTQKIPEHRCG